MSRSKRRQKRTQQPQKNPLIKSSLDQAVSLHQSGELQQAAQIYEQIITVDPENADAFHLLGVIASQLGNRETAIDLIARAIELKPSRSSFHYNLGKAFQEEGREEEAELSYRRAIEVDAKNGDAHLNLGIVLRAQDKLEEAIQAYKRALEIKPNNVEAHFALGNLLKQQGKFEEAIQSYKQALEIKPDYAAAHRLIARITQHQDYDDGLKEMEDQLEDPETTEEQTMQLCFGLGKAFEDLELYQKAFGYIAEANRIAKQTMEFNMEEMNQRVQKLIDTFDTELFEQFPSSGIDDRTPIFILGMPRSGTTLTEQILASHSQVHGAGELRDLEQVLLRTTPKLTTETFPQQITDLDDGELAQLGRNYVACLKTYSADASHVTDKMPANFLHIGVIKLILPQAKIVHCQRHPLDICLSCFKNYFPQQLKFTYDLTELGQYYCLYHKLMAHWHHVLPNYILDFRYEDLIADQQQQTERLLEFCGLPWEDTCLQFHQTDRPVKTASAEQVRRPIYQGSVELWKQYEDELQPLISVLEPILKEYN